MKKISSLILITITVSLGLWYYFNQYQSKPYTGPIEKVTVGISATSLLPSLIHVADEKGFFLEEGIDLTIKGYPTGKAALEATLKEEVNIGTVADPPIVFSSFKRNDFIVFAGILDSAQHAKALARKDSGIKTPQDLVGKKVATTIGTTAHFFMDIFLTFNNLDFTSIELVNLKPKEMVNAITNNEVDAIFAWEPNITNAQKLLGNNAILLPSDVGYNSTFNLVSKKDYLKTNPELAKRVLKALIKAEKFAKNNRRETINIIASRLKTDRQIIDQLWDGYKFGVTLSQSLVLTLEDQARWAIKNKFVQADKSPNYLDYIYFDALENVKPEAITIVR